MNVLPHGWVCFHDEKNVKATFTGHASSTEEGEVLYYASSHVEMHFTVFEIHCGDKDKHSHQAPYTHAALFQ